MKWRRNPCVQAILGQLDAVGIKSEIATTNGTHIQIKWTANGNKRLYVTGATPSDRLAPKKAKCDVRRMLKMDGVMA
jgi:hypothetical protein